MDKDTKDTKANPTTYVERNRAEAQRTREAQADAKEKEQQAETAREQQLPKNYEHQLLRVKGKVTKLFDGLKDLMPGRHDELKQRIIEHFGEDYEAP